MSLSPLICLALLAAAPTKLRPDRILIPAGPTIQGSTKGADDERPSRKKTLPAFKIDRTEVTRAAYARCVAARRCAKTEADLQTDPLLPMTNVNWHEARTFCTYAGGRLPTEAEWEKAARGTGVLDLAGNVWEWVEDRYDLEPDRRVVRGGSCCSYFVAPRSANRNAWDPKHRDLDLGFRCVER
jgi:formylglycine-generating enzyme required for sulfatase activity